MSNQRQQQTGNARSESLSQNQTTAATRQQSTSGTVALTPQQSTRVQQTILARSDVPRANRVDFALNVGTAVPSYIRVAEVPPVLIEIHPEWRGYEYFVVEDDIVIVDRGRRVVARVPARSRGVYASAESEFMNLSRPQIIELQEVLIRRGYFHGRPDGVFGPTMRQALIRFQRSQGLQATGYVDNRTVSVLGLSQRFGVRSQSPGAAATSGQSNLNGAQSPNAQSPDARTGAASSNRPSTSGQAQPSQNMQRATPGQAQDQRAAPSNRLSTSGQALPSQSGSPQAGRDLKRPSQSGASNGSGAGAAGSSQNGPSAAALGGTSGQAQPNDRGRHGAAESKSHRGEQ
jgi:hypothetical protein